MAALAVSLKLTVLSCHQCLLHNRHLDVEVLLGEVEVGLEGLRDATVLGFRKRERPRFVLPGNTVKVQQASTFALCVVREARSLHAPGWLGPHPPKVAVDPDAAAADLIYDRGAWRGCDSHRRNASSSTSTHALPQMPSRSRVSSSSCSS